MEVENTGHTVSFTFEFADGIPPSITSGPLGNDVYILNNFHFHWGGSEHTYNSMKLAAEIHLVHFNSKYGSLTTASSYADGLAVLGFVYSIVPSLLAPENLPFIKYLQFVREPGSKYNETKKLFSLYNFIRREDFMVASYRGSLTTPPCHESVTWMLVPLPLIISSSDLRLLRSIKNKEGKLLKRNSRPLQKSNGRKAVIYFQWQ